MGKDPRQPMKNSITRIDFNNYLNDNAPAFESEEWIIGGKLRVQQRMAGNYAQALKKHDPATYEKKWVEYYSTDVSNMKK